MNRYLLSALMLSSMLSAAPAFAEIKLDLGGYFKGYAGFADQDQANLREFDVKRKSQVFFEGSTTLTNGLTVGYHSRLFQENEATTGTQMERSFLYFSGDWGLVNLGREAGVGYILQAKAPGADSNQDGVNVEMNFFNISGNVDRDYQHAGTSSNNASKFADKISYLTPKINGFQFGASYSPEYDQQLIGDNTAGMEADNTTSDFKNMLEGAGYYEGKIGDVGLSIGAGYSTADREVEAANDDNYVEWNTGVKLTYEGVSFGGAYNTDNGGLDNNGDTDNWTVGLAYAWDAYSIGASYFNSDGEVAGAQDDEFDRYMIGAGFKMAPGIEFRTAAGYYDLDRAGTANDNDGYSITAGTVIDF
jgi:outer membrane protein OmpU